MHTVIVRYALPIGVEREVMLEEFRETEDRFAAIPGLVRKYFCYDEPSHTGHSVYLWETEEQARAFHGPQFVKKIVEIFDAVPECIFADTLLIVDNEQDRITALPE
jgi:hypothetical protein